MPAATVLPPEPAPPQVIHSCPNCSHWLPEGTLACPDCQTLVYGQHLSSIAAEAQSLEHQGQLPQARDRWRSALRWLPEDTRQAQSIHQHIQAIDGRMQADEDKRARWSKRLGPLAPIAFFLLKAKTYLFLLLKFKFLLSILSFFGLYWVLFRDWRFALGFTTCILLHEMGHYVAVKRRGLKAELPIFFPGLGAYVRWYSMGVSKPDLAAIALAGPLFGLFTAVVCLALAWFGHSPLFLFLANVGAWINFFNLLPILGLDGAQATYALSRIQRGLIAATCIIFFALTCTGGFGDHIQWIFLIVGLGMVWRCFTDDDPETGDTRTFAIFQALIILLGFLLYLTPIPQPH